MKAISLLVVDDHPFHRMGIMALIGTRADMVVVGRLQPAKMLFGCFKSIDQTSH